MARAGAAASRVLAAYPALAACMLLAACLAGCGNGGHAPSRPPAATSPPSAPAEGRLAVGLTEPNPNLLWSGAARPDLPDRFGPWRDRVEGLRPAYYRLAVVWPSVQPRADRPPNWEVAGDGCMRGRAPCGPFRGIRDVLQAVRSEQQAGHGFDVAVVIYGTPAWAAHGPDGCERAGTTSWSRPITREGLRAYRSLIRSLLELGRSVGVALRWWSPWNEPNHPAFISPQRTRCAVSSPTLAPSVYAQLVRAAKDELGADSQPHDLVLGELAGTRGPGPRGTGVGEFVAALPDDVACSAAVWAQHAYAQAGPRGNEVGPIAQLEHALDRRPCTRDKPVWVTETGVGAAHAGHRRDTSPSALRAQCRLMAQTLARWYHDPRVTAAFQYTFREDNAFPVGLADSTLMNAYPVYHLWKAWGGARAPDGPEPALPGACSG